MINIIFYKLQENFVVNSTIDIFLIKNMRVNIIYIRFTLKTTIFLHIIMYFTAQKKKQVVCNYSFT
ncbi:hypothetical protein PFAG_05931 [Plasmodium falciparum Santa Lucia]|uniref:Uncharacterized protein n=2 Tax=Plasmodium falciparum TaxID=5833 RepID=A0A024UXR8_PLAFA|nr:hypothetical protein PFFVO_06034 [Plasmodium falciparum Vietnam Oak-Knoll (FVO)]EUT77376.1 hypothetical protein PFAG_05931 [Plasmodium falciparum Santa Lucia]